MGSCEDRSRPEKRCRLDGCLVCKQRVRFSGFWGRRCYRLTAWTRRRYPCTARLRREPEPCPRAVRCRYSPRGCSVGCVCGGCGCAGGSSSSSPAKAACTRRTRHASAGKSTHHSQSLPQKIKICKKRLKLFSEQFL